MNLKSENRNLGFVQFLIRNLLGVPTWTGRKGIISSKSKIKQIGGVFFNFNLQNVKVSSSEILKNLRNQKNPSITRNNLDSHYVVMADDLINLFSSKSDGNLTTYDILSHFSQYYVYYL